MNTNKAYSIEEACRALEHYCAYQERSYKEVAQKLQKMGMIPEAQEKIIMHLLQHDFLNEERFAKAFAGGKFRINKWGKLKIRKALQQKGVSAPNIAIGLNEINEDTYKETLEVLLEKYKSQHHLQKEKLSYQENQKIVRYLQQKGFESNLIYECLSNTFHAKGFTKGL